MNSSEYYPNGKSKELFSKNSSSPIVITVATKETPEYLNFVNSLEKHKYRYKILGKNKKWTGFDLKTKEYESVLNQYHPDQLLILCDSYDLIFVNNWNSSYIPEKGVIVVSAEHEGTIGAPMPNFRRYHNQKDVKPLEGGYEYPNSGFIMGYCKDLVTHYKETIKESEKTGIVDDQILICRIMNKFPQKYRLDLSGKYCVTAHPPTHPFIKINGNPVSERHNDKLGVVTYNDLQYPLALHFAYIPRTQKLYDQIVRDLL